MEEKRFYWIKLKTDFFSRSDIDFILSQANGCEYVVLYQMLCLNTVNNDGRFETKIGEVIIPYDIDKIVRDTKYFDYDTVAIALELYKKLGLIYEEEDGVLKIADYENIVGSETSSAQRVREWRKRKMLQCNKNVTEDVTSDVTQEYRDKSIEYRDKILDSNIKENTKRKKFEKPTLEEIEAYKKEANLINLDTHRFLDYYDSNGWMVGKNHMKDWKATARNWNRKSNNTTPAWFNSDNQKEEVTDEEMQEIYDLFKEFRED